MKRFITCLFAVLSILSCVPLISLHGQEGTAKPRLAPGTLISVQPDLDYTSTYNRDNLVEVLATLKESDPDLADDPRFNPDVWAKDIRFSRDIWSLQFSFKPLRIIEVDIPNKNGSFDKKSVWYLVYNVKNLGPAEFETVKKDKDKGDEYRLKKPGGTIGTAIDKEVKMPIAKDTQAESQYEQKTVKQTRDAPLTLRELGGLFVPVPGQDEPISFVPQFLLATDSLPLDTKLGNNPQTGRIESETERGEVVYRDRIIPIALGPIMKREGMSTIPSTTVSMAAKPLESGEDRWGVAMWTDIDSRIAKFSIYVAGLTNEYRWKNDENHDGEVGSGREMEQKVLKINWWRRGDQYSLSDSQIQYGQPGTVDYEWIFR